MLDDLLKILVKLGLPRTIASLVFNLFNTFTQEDRDFNIGLFGPSRTGKTTLIASMVEEFTKYSETLYHQNGSYLKLSASDQITKQKLSDRINYLKSGIDFGRFTTGTLAGTEDHEVFKLSFEEGKNKSFKQNFALHDFPGGWLNQPDKINELDIKSWDVCILPIDAATIMESSRISQQQKARKSLGINEIDVFIRDWIAGRNGQQGLCILSPVKCETYFAYPRMSSFLSDKSQILFSKITQNYYKEALAYIRNSQNIQCLYMPVNTIGCCYLSLPTWTEDGDLKGEYSISPEKDMNRWNPYGPVNIMIEICYFIAMQLTKLPTNMQTEQIRSFIIAATDLKELSLKNSNYASNRQLVLQNMI